MKNYVCGFLFDKDKKVVLLIQKNKPAWQKGLLNGIGGKIEEKETAATAMVREFQEEAGMKIVRWKKFCELETQDKSARVFFFYSIYPALILPYKSMTDEKVIIFPIKNINRVSCIPNLRWLIPMCLDTQHIYGNFICNASMK